MNAQPSFDDAKKLDRLNRIEASAAIRAYLDAADTALKEAQKLANSIELAGLSVDLGSLIVELNRLEGDMVFVSWDAQKLAGFPCDDYDTLSEEKKRRVGRYIVAMYGGQPAAAPPAPTETTGESE